MFFCHSICHTWRNVKLSQKPEVIEDRKVLSDQSQAESHASDFHVLTYSILSTQRPNFLLPSRSLRFWEKNTGRGPSSRIISDLQMISSDLVLKMLWDELVKPLSSSFLISRSVQEMINLLDRRKFLTHLQRLYEIE